MSTRVSSALSLLAGLFLLAAPTGAQEQITGVVTTAGGVPLEGVAVEAWAGGRRLSATLSDGRGRFLLADSAVARAEELRVSALGFHVRTVSIRPGIGSYEIRLNAEPLMIEGLSVIMEGDVCLRADSEQARVLWEAARGRYLSGLDTLGIATYLAEADTVVRRERIGPLQLPALALSQRSSGSILRFSWSRRIEREGYAFKVRKTDGSATFDSWVYAPLEADLAPHFTDALFGDQHRFVEAIEDSDGWTVTFCPKDAEDDKPSIRGTLTLAPDTALTTVEWSFETPDPVERAGGRATFAPMEASPGGHYPLPSEALIWYQVPDGRYFQRYQRYEGWRVAPGDSVPQLPLRRAASTGARR